MTEHEMRFWAHDRMRELLEDAEVHRSIRAAAAPRPTTTWRSRMTVLRRSRPVGRALLRP